MTKGWFRPIHGCYSLPTLGGRCVTEGICSSRARKWNRNHFCFLALFVLTKAKKWIELKSGEIVQQAVSGRSPQDHGTFSADHCQAHPNPFSVRNVNLFSKSEQLIKHNHKLNKPLPEDSTFVVWDVELGGFWKVLIQLQMMPGAAIIAACRTLDSATGVLAVPSSRLRSIIHKRLFLSRGCWRELVTGQSSGLCFKFHKLCFKFHNFVFSCANLPPSPNLVRGPKRVFVTLW